LDLQREMGRTGSGDAVGALVGCAGLAQVWGQPEHAVHLLSAAAALLASTGGTLNPVYVPLRDRVEAALSAELGETKFAALWGEGEALAAEGAERVVT
jgi:hypothetical protein